MNQMQKEKVIARFGDHMRQAEESASEGDWAESLRHTAEARWCLELLNLGPDQCPELHEIMGVERHVGGANA